MLFQATLMFRLGDFVEKCYYDGGIPKDAKFRPFNNGHAKDPPLLRSRGVNRILIYPGSFNPPHKGHMQLLNHVFHNAGDDLQIAAAIILPVDDVRLAIKTRHEKRTLVLPRERRNELWRSSGVLTDRIWLCDRSESDWEKLKKKLEDKFREKNVEVKFILLGGPDWVNSTRIPEPAYWGCTDVITSDVSRPVNYRYGNTLCQLSSCTAWEKPRFDPERLQKQIRARMRGKSRQDIEKAFVTAAAKINASWVCRFVSHSRGIVRFVPGDLSLQSFDPPSSTYIRQIIGASPLERLERLEQSLQDWALAPRLLAQMVPKYVRENDPSEEVEEMVDENCEIYENIMW